MKNEKSSNTRLNTCNGAATRGLKGLLGTQHGYPDLLRLRLTASDGLGVLAGRGSWIGAFRHYNP